MTFPRSFLVLLALWIVATGSQAAEPVEINSLAELAKAAGQNGQTVKMKPGVYRLNEYIPLNSIADRRKRKEWQFIRFSGSNNVFDLSGVTIELDTALRAALRSPIHTDEFQISGADVTLKGLTVTSKGDGKAFGGAVLGVVGKGTTLRDCTIHVQGSAPYGYGDLFGKGGFKHSGVHITGDQTRIIGCKVFNKSFGHGFYLQEDANDVHFENCYVEGVMRSTDEVLAEKTGMAADHKFQTVMKNREGDLRILPGYMKALSEDAFRTYGQHQNLTLKNCTAKNMRGGFELRTKTAPVIENCTATGCERAFWVSTGARVIRCKGDARHGPLLFVEGDNAEVDVELLPDEAKGVKVHAIATIYGSGNRVTIKGKRAHALHIMIGFTPPGMGAGSAPFGEKDARNNILRNETTMPVEIGAKAKGGEVISKGPVRNGGKDVRVQAL